MEREAWGARRDARLLHDGQVCACIISFSSSPHYLLKKLLSLRKKGRKTAVRTCDFKPLVCSQSLKFTVSSPYPGGIGEKQGARAQEAWGEGEGRPGALSYQPGQPAGRTQHLALFYSGQSLFCCEISAGNSCSFKKEKNTGGFIFSSFVFLLNMHMGSKMLVYPMVLYLFKVLSIKTMHLLRLHFIKKKILFLLHAY